MSKTSKGSRLKARKVLIAVALVLLPSRVAWCQSYDETTIKVSTAFMKMRMANFNDFIRDRAIWQGAQHGISHYHADFVSGNWKWNFEISHRLSENARVSISTSYTRDEGGYQDYDAENGIVFSSHLSTFDVMANAYFLYPFGRSFTGYVGVGGGVAHSSMRGEEQYTDELGSTVDAAWQAEYSGLIRVGRIAAGVEYSLSRLFVVSTEIGYDIAFGGDMEGTGATEGPLRDSRGETVKFDFSGFSVVVGVGTRFSF
jgi:opacity protein-like surface antigen